MIFISLVLTRKVEIEFVVAKAKAKAKDKCNHDDALNRQCKTNFFNNSQFIKTRVCR
jgi:hypothetical protein